MRGTEFVLPLLSGCLLIVGIALVIQGFYLDNRLANTPLPLRTFTLPQGKWHLTFIGGNIEARRLDGDEPEVIIWDMEADDE